MGFWYEVFCEFWCSRCLLRVCMFLDTNIMSFANFVSSASLSTRFTHCWQSCFSSLGVLLFLQIFISIYIHLAVFRKLRFVQMNKSVDSSIETSDWVYIRNQITIVQGIITKNFWDSIVYLRKNLHNPNVDGVVILRFLCNISFHSCRFLV